ncbi:hypothetical protein HYV85_02260 [Candidatus Woesearchaeota archaeon]|nr:hypothetical protein [Candidatus Woesearchaeota archaeon]
MSFEHFRDLYQIMKEEGIKPALIYDLQVARLRLDRLITHGSLTIPELLENRPTELKRVAEDRYAYRRYGIS